MKSRSAFESSRGRPKSPDSDGFDAAVGGVITADDRGVIVARGERVALRTLTPDDLELLAEWVDDPFLEQMVGSELLRTFKHVYDTHPSFYDALLSDPTQVVFMIVPLRGPSRPAGLVRFFNIHLVEGYAFLETLIGDHRAMRRGYGVEASKLLCAYGLDVLGLYRIEAKVYEFNTLSINSLRRNGFRLEGVLRKAGYNAGERVDVLVFGMLREELEAQRRKEVHQEHYHFPFAAAGAGSGGSP